MLYTQAEKFLLSLRGDTKNYYHHDGVNGVGSYTKLFIGNDTNSNPFQRRISELERQIDFHRVEIDIYTAKTTEVCFFLYPMFVTDVFIFSQIRNKYFILFVIYR